jgi:hypothetical protein
MHPDRRDYLFAINRRIFMGNSSWPSFWRMGRIERFSDSVSHSVFLLPNVQPCTARLTPHGAAKGKYGEKPQRNKAKEKSETDGMNGFGLLWLIRLMIIQGTVAPCQVQEWMQCTRHLPFVP